MSKMTVREEVEKAVGIKRKPKDSDQTWFKRLAEAVDSKLSDDEFSALSEPAQEWLNAAIEAVSADDDVPDFSSSTKTVDKKGKKVVEKEEEEEEKPKKKGKKVVEEEEEEDEDEKPKKKGKKVVEEEEDEDEDEDEKPKKKGKKVVEEEEDEDEDEKPKKKVAKKEKKEKKAGEVGDSTKLLYIICDNPKANVEKILAIAAKKGMTLSDATIKIRYSLTQLILKYLASKE